MFATRILFHLKFLYCSWRGLFHSKCSWCSRHIYYIAHCITYCSYIYNEVLSCIFKINTKTNRNVINSCYYGEMPNVIIIIIKKILIIIKSIILWNWNHLFTKNYFRKKKINCYEFMPGEFQVICGSMVGGNRRSPASTKTPVHIKILSWKFPILNPTDSWVTYL